MVKRISQLASALGRSGAAVRWPLAWGLLAWLPAAVAAPVVPAVAAPYVYEARAHLVDVVRAYVSTGDSPMPGAGVRAFEDSDEPVGGTERFEIRWYANSPGIPPGVVVWLEAIQEHSPVIKNHYLRVDGKSEGHVRSIIEIPPDQIRRAGRVVKWRIRVVWRGRLLASQASANWEG